MWGTVTNSKWTSVARNKTRQTLITHWSPFQVSKPSCEWSLSLQHVFVLHPNHLKTIGSMLTGVKLNSRLSIAMFSLTGGIPSSLTNMKSLESMRLHWVLRGKPLPPCNESRRTCKNPTGYILKDFSLYSRKLNGKYNSAISSSTMWTLGTYLCYLGAFCGSKH